MGGVDLYVGREVDPQAMKPGDGPILLDPDRLTRHAVCFGMTGSGKTGLCVSLLEEVAMAGVPVLVIDPKGDMANLALAFRDQNPADFEAWIDPAEAEREGVSVPDLAVQTASKWKKGLADWGVDADRVAAFCDQVEVTVHSPGSTSGVPVDVLGSLTAPPEGLSDDPEALRDLVAGTVSGLLGLVGIDADPVKDPQHIVMSSIVETAWAQGEPLTLETLIVQLVDPPFAKVGVFPVDTFFPRKDRLELAMSLNGIVASPSFAPWQQGTDLDPETLLAPRNGKTQVRVFYLAHLDESQRTFFVSMLLNRVVAWSRRQPGTGSLRALVYFDEVFGYLPPYPKNPPTKKPVLTLMKQARAVGVGTMLVTQNPVDVDYAAMSNAGTWLIGRLQTRQDRDRVLDGLAGATGDIDRKTLGGWLEALPSRTFLLREIKGEPRVIHSRWAISYLRGPLTRIELKRLAESAATGSTAQATPAYAPPAPPPETAAQPAEDAVPDGYSPTPPPAPDGYPYRFLDPRVVFSARLRELFEPQSIPRRSDGRIVWEPALAATLYLTFDEGRDYRTSRDEHRLFFPIDGHEMVLNADPPFEDGDFLSTAPDQSLYGPLPALIDEKKELQALEKQVVDDVYRGETERMFRQRTLKLTSRGGETREQFEERVKAAIQDRIDAKVAKLKERLDSKIDRLEAKRDKLQRDVAQHAADARAKMAAEAVNIGETVFGLFFGGRKKSLNTVMTKRQQTARANERASRAEEEIVEIEREVYDLEDECNTAILEIQNEEEAHIDDIEETEVRLERNDVRLDAFGIVWIPVTRPV